jgi:acetoin utilization protein AcuB
MKERLANLTVDEYTTPCPIVVQSQDNVQHALDIMDKNQIRHLPVIDGDQIVGILSERNLKILELIQNKDKVLVTEVMQENPFRVYSTDSLMEVAYTMSEKKIGSAIVLDGSSNLDGIFTTTDALNALVEVLRET